MTKKIEDLLNETLAPEMKASIQEALDSKVAAMRVELEESVRDELSARYEHDKTQLVEAMDKMLTDAIRVHEEAKAAEIAKLVEARDEYRAALNEARTEARTRISKLAEASSKLITEHLKKEVVSLRETKLAIASEAEMLSESVEGVKAKLVENHEKHLEKINAFVTRQLTKELNEFAQDKRALVETRVKLIAENKQKLAAAQAKFIAESAKKVDAVVTETIKREMTQLHEDIERNRQNSFGRRIFEAVAAEYMTSYLAEGTEVRALQKVLEAKEAEIASKATVLAEAEQKLNEAAQKVAAAERKAQLAEGRRERTKIMSELLSNIRGEKRAVMESMLENTKTGELRAAFDKLLPVVLSEGTRKATPTGNKTVLKETQQVVTGDRAADRVIVETTTEDDGSIAEIIQLAGIKKN